MKTAVSVLTIGSEILDGRVVNTNAAYVCEKLTLHGIEVSEVLSCTDREEEIVRAVGYLLQNSSFLVVSGGLGPTTDDLTREALARFAGKELLLDQKVLEALRGLFEKRKRAFSPGNAKQALFPEGSSVIPNPIGTAAGFILKLAGGKKIATLPGVPRELKAMFLETVLPEILSAGGASSPFFCRSFKVFGLPESVIGDRIRSSRIDPRIAVSYRASFPEIHVLLKTRGPEVVLEEAFLKAREATGSEYVFTTELQIPFENVLQDLILASGRTVSVAESCTGGLLGGILTRTPGCSAWFKGGAIVYSNELKTGLLEVPREILEKDGAVSHLTARMMAEGARRRFGSDLAISITGIAGPDGGSREKPRGTFYVGLASADGGRSYGHFIDSERDMVRTYAAYMAMDTLRRSFLGLAPCGEVG